MTLLQKILFTVVFTIYGAILYGISYYLLAWWDPALVADPARLGNEHLLFVTAAFTVIVALAYVGAGYVVIGRLPGQSPFDSDDDWRPRRSSSSAKQPARKQARPLQPEVPAGLRASRKDFGRRDENRASSREQNRPQSRGAGRPKPRGDSPGS